MGVLDGKSALITGGTKGLGAELSLALARAGADVAVLGRDKASGDEVAASVAALGRRAVVIAADVTEEAQMDAAAAEARSALGKIDILVCTAGVGTPRQPIWEQGTAEFRATFDVNVLGCMLAMRAVLPIMIEQRSGRIINIGGTYGHKGIPLSAVYASTKWALRGLTKSVALEVGQYGVTANVVAPGGVEGPRLTREFQKSADKEGLTYQQVVDRFTSRSALGRLVTGDEIAAAVIHLASDAGRNVTGQDLIVDAGVIV
jgi:NAD(P)-dependent dehydrogenase (short-subunit alcohol dehydrogenase family)